MWDSHPNSWTRQAAAQPKRTSGTALARRGEREKRVCASHTYEFLPLQCHEQVVGMADKGGNSSSSEKGDPSPEWKEKAQGQAEQKPEKEKACSRKEAQTVLLIQCLWRHLRHPSSSGSDYRNNRKQDYVKIVCKSTELKTFFKKQPLSIGNTNC